MQKLHLVGFTTDQKGLILSARRGARTGSFHLPVDEELARSVEELRAKQVEAEAENAEEEVAARPTRVESALPVKEIQARLRQGRSVADVAKAAGVDPEWVERFAPPVFAERAQVIAKVQSSALQRARLGPSEQPIAESIRRNLADRNVALTPDEFAEGWTARQLADGRWVVRFHYRYRGNDSTLRFDVDDAGTISAADRPSGQLGYIAPATPPPPAREPRPGSVPTPSRVSGPTKRPTVTVGFRPDDASGQATSPAAKERERANEAMRKATAKAVAEAERAAARRAKEREAEQLRRQREAEAEEARQARAQAAAERAKAAAARKKAAAAKKRADDRAKAKAAKLAADQARRAEATLRAAERRTAAAKKAAVKKAAAQKAAAKKATKKKATAKKAVAKKTAAAKAPAAQPAPLLVLRPTATESTAPAPSSNGGAPETPPGETPPRPLRAT